MKTLFTLLLSLVLAAPVWAQQLNPGGGIITVPPAEGVFDSMVIGNASGGPTFGAVNALSYRVNGVPLATTNLGDVTVGPWTPTLVGATTPGTPTYSVQSGSFEKNGRQVTVRFYMAVANLGGMAGTVSIGNLPYPNGGVANDLGICSFSVWTGVTLTAGFAQLAAMVPTGQSAATLYGSGSGQTGPLVVQATNLLAAPIFVGMCNYRAS